MKSYRRIAKVSGALIFSLLVVSSAGAETTHKISGSEISSLQLAVRKGESLAITNSEICLGQAGTTCEIVIESGASLESINSDFGARLTIYREDLADSGFNVSNGEVNSSVKEGLPAGYSVEAYAGEVPPGLKLTNAELPSYSTKVAANEVFTVTNSDLCLTPVGDACRILVSTGAELEFTNTKLGVRMTLVTRQSHLTGLRWANVTFAGSIVVSDTNAKPPARVAATPEVSDSAIVEELQKRAIPAERTARGVVMSLPDVFFEFDRSNLTSEARKNVGTIAEVLSGYVTRRIAIEGHTDAMGTDAYNQKLSRDRADAVETALIDDGIDRGRLTSRGFGEERPVASNQTEEGRARNRRVEVILEKHGVPNVTDSLNRRSREGNAEREHKAEREHTAE